MMVDTRGTGEAPVPEDESVEVGLAVTNFLVVVIAAKLLLLASLWLFNQKAY
jgi:hypothetical protein